jgi:hypothetical protein
VRRSALVFQKLLAAYQVKHLVSPPGTPEYNGAIEAPQTQANETSRPWGTLQPTPKGAWCARLPLREHERRRFTTNYDRLEPAARAERGLLPGVPLDPATQRSVDRIAITRAIFEGLYLSFRRRRMTLPTSKQKTATIS